MAWQGSNAQTDCISFSIFALSNPHPDKKIKNIKIATNGSTNYLMVVGMTLAKDALYFDDGGKGVINMDNWLPLESISNKITDGSALDVSSFLDKPAGKKGSIKVSEDKFVFENGEVAKLWGTNLVGKACFPEKEQAGMIANLMAKCGFNIVRMSDFENILFDDNDEISDDIMDKFTFFVAKLKEEGIYTYLSIIKGKTAADFYVDDKVERELNKIKKVLLSKNPYTKMSLAEDPAVAFVEGIDNISSFDFTCGNSNEKITNQEYEILQNEFTRFLKGKYGNTSVLKKAWKYNGTTDGLGSSENLENGTVFITDLWKDSFYTKERKRDTAEFFVSLQDEFNAKLERCIKEINFKGIFTGNTNKLSDIYRWSNKEKVKDALQIADVYANSKTDFVARKAVMSYPYGGYTANAQHKIFFHSNDSILSQLDGGIIGEFAKNRVLGKPYVVAAYNSAFPNSYIAEVLPVMAVFSARNGWTSLNYAFAVDEITSDSFISDVYSMYNNPARMSLAAASARLFYTSEESEKVYENKMSTESVFLGDSDLDVTNEMLLKGKYGVTFPDSQTKNNTVKYGSNVEYINDKTLYWNMKEGIFRYKNDFCDLFVGDMLQKRCSDNYEIDLIASNAAVSLTSCDGKKISDSGRLLLTVVSGANNTGYKTDRDMIDFGRSPIKIETIVGNVELKVTGNWDVYAIDESGNRKSNIKVTVDKFGHTSFKINNYYQKNEERAVNFEIVKKQQ